MKRRNGFTLIELLVVFAMIAILAAILFPVFAKAREKARQTACLSNLKQLGLGFAQYVQDFDELQPNGVYQGSGWASQIYSYTKSRNLYLCPDDTTNNADTSYGYNAALSISGGNGGGGNNQASLVAPAKTVCLFEVTGGSGFYSACDFSLPPSATKSFPYPDIHVKAYSGPDGVPDAAWSPSGNGGNGGGFYNYLVYDGDFEGNGTMQYATGVLRNADGTTGSPYGNGKTIFAARTGRHNDGANYLLDDYHAKWFRPTAVSAGSDNPTVGDCGSTSGVAANTSCADATVAATFSAK